MHIQDPIFSLGYDPLTDRKIISPENFGKLFSNKTMSIKGVLLDQSVIAGIGNWMVSIEIIIRSLVDEHI